MHKKHIFVVGAGRSGTKFLMNILNNSAYVHIAPEIHYFSSLIHNGFLKNLRKRIRKARKTTVDELIECLQTVKHFGTYWRRDIHFPAREIRKWFSDRDTVEKNIYQFIIEQDYLQNGRDKTELRYIGEKTPSNIFHVNRLFRWYPDATILFIYRNPIDVLGSEVNKNHKPDYPLSKRNTFYPYGLAIYVFHVWLMAAIISIYYQFRRKNRFLVISYEELNSHVEDIVKRISSKIEIPYTKDLCEVKRVDSSYSKGEDESYWYPPRWIVLFYNIFLSLPRKMLDSLSLKP